MKIWGAIALACLLSQTAHAQPAVYYGGPVVSVAKVYAVYWRSNVNAQVRSEASGFFTDVLASSYVDLLAEYGTAGRNGMDGQPGSNQHITRGTFGGNLMITPSVTATTVSDAQIQSELMQQITAGNLPAP